MAVTISGSGGVTYPDGTTQAVGTGPSFSAYQGSAQTITTATWTKVNLQTEEWDTKGDFNNSTTYRFTPTVAGYYWINGAVAYNSATVNQPQASIYKNGSAYKLLAFTTTGALNYPMVAGSCLVYLNGSTDYVELFTYHNTGSSVVLAPNTATRLEGFLARLP
jgi:hypothetical protein